MTSISCAQPMPDYNALIPEERQKFCKLVHDLLRDNKWMLLEEAQRIAYQQVCVESVEELIGKFTANWSDSSWLRSIIIVSLALILSACTHPITINPVSTPQQTGSNLFSTKIAAYVMTDADRSSQVTAPGGGGDKVSYFPYKDLEKGVRDVLKSLYSDVVLVNSPKNLEAIKQDGIAFVYSLNILTSSSSDCSIYLATDSVLYRYLSNRNRQRRKCSRTVDSDWTWCS